MNPMHSMTFLHKHTRVLATLLVDKSPATQTRYAGGCVVDDGRFLYVCTNLSSRTSAHTVCSHLGAELRRSESSCVVYSREHMPVHACLATRAF